MDALSACEAMLGAGKKTSGSEYEFLCPNGCGPKLYVNVDRGVYQCWVCGGASRGLPAKTKYENAKKGQWFGTGSIRLLATYFNMEYLLEENNDTAPKIVRRTDEEPFSIGEFRVALTTIFKEPELTKSHEEFLSNRGFSDEFWEKRGLSSGFGANPLKAMSAEVALSKLKSLLPEDKRRELHIQRDDGKPEAWIQPGKILLPYFDFTGESVLGVRSRSTLSIAKIKYMWPRGTKASGLIYNLPAIKEHSAVVITEGEFKAALPSLFGIPTIATPGAGIGHEACSRVLSRTGVRRALICFDSESKESTAKTIEAEASALKKVLSFVDIEAKTVFLPLNGQSKMDLDTFVIQEGPSALRSLLLENL